MAVKGLLLSEEKWRYPVISSDSYAQIMKEQVCPMLDKLRTVREFSLEGTQKLYCEYYNISERSGCKGTVFISHGFSESCEKYREVIYYFLTEGYCVVIMEHIGHGRSRKKEETNIPGTATYIEKFQDYIDGMNVIAGKVIKKLMPPYYLYAHSMGGAIGTAFMEQHPDFFKKAVLSAPMLEINCGGAPKLLAKTLALLGCAFGLGRKFFIGCKPYCPKEDFKSSASDCRERYMYYYKIQKKHTEFHNGGASFHWAKEAFSACDKMIMPKNCGKLSLPIILFQSGNDAFVSPGGQEKFIRNIPDGTIVRLPRVKHEIYMADDETLSLYWAAVFDFLR